MLWGDIVDMCHENYNDVIDRLALTAELMEADLDLLSGTPTIPVKEVLSDLRTLIDEQIKK
jgi:hypothetical protein